jgi:hypothetical protein
MLTATDLDDETSLAANKIHNIGSDWLLPHELEAAELARAKMPPQQLLRGGGVLSKPSRQPGFRSLCAAHSV